MAKKKNKWTKKDYENMIERENTENWLEQNAPLFDILTSEKRKKQRNLVIDTLNTKQGKDIEKLFQQMLKTRKILPKKVLKKLVKNRKELFKMASKKTSLKEKKKNLKIKGGGMVIPLFKYAMKIIKKKSTPTHIAKIMKRLPSLK